MSSFIVTIDQGSSATKVLAFDHQDQSGYRAFRPLKMERPQPLHVEQDPVHVLEESRAALKSSKSTGSLKLGELPAGHCFSSRLTSSDSPSIILPLRMQQPWDVPS